MKIASKLILATLTLASAAEEGSGSLRGLQGNGNGNSDEEEETIIVTFKGENDGSASSKCDSIAKAHGGNKKASLDKVMNGCTMKVKKNTVAALEKNADVLSVEHDSIVTASQTAPWGLDRINQCTGTDGSATKVDAAGTKVFVLDTGVHGSHSDLAAHMGTGSGCHASFVAAEPNAEEDGHGHGTHVASTACGTTYGVAENCNVCAVKVLDSNGSGWKSDVIAGINHVAANCGNGCVMNMSLGGGYSASENNAVASAVAAGAVVVVAAGNDSSDACNYSPASADAAVTVGSSTSSDGESSFSNFGSCVDVYAPGSSILAAYPPNTAGYMSGTSMASPHVAGIAAGIFGEGATSPAEVESTLMSRVSNVVGNGNLPLATIVGSQVGEDNCEGTTTSTTQATTPATTTTTTTTTPPPPASYDTTLAVIPDYWPGETYVQMFYDYGAGPVLFGNWGAGYMTSPFGTYSFSGNWPTAYCYTVTVGDTWGDGIYYGSFSLSINGGVAYTYGPPGYTDGMFYTKSVSFGNSAIGACAGGGTTSTVESNGDVEVRDEPKGNKGGNGKGKGNGSGGASGATSVETVQPPAPVEGTD